MGKEISCFKDKKSALDHMRALYANEEKSVVLEDLMSLLDDPEAAAKCMGMDMPMYVPYNVTSLGDAIAAQDAQAHVKEMKNLVDMFQQVVSNILYSQDVPDKKAALNDVVSELSSVLGDESAAVDMTAEDTTVEDAAKAKRDASPQRGDYLVATSSDPKDWHLPVKENGKPSHILMGAAFAALTGGYRGKKYAGPNKESALVKLKKLYRAEGMEFPGGKSIFLDDPELVCIKSISDSRVGAYAVLWGDEDHKDLTKEFFDLNTEELTVIFDGVGKLPYLYNHTLNDAMKSTVIGVVDTLITDSVGLWYEAELKIANEYESAIKKLLKDGKLKTSTQTFYPARRVAKNGRIERWPIVEISATPTPAEARMFSVEVVKSAFTQIGCDNFWMVAKEAGLVEGMESDDQGVEKARLYAMLENERAFLETLI